jgi:hypothetical protein
MNEGRNSTMVMSTMIKVCRQTSLRKHLSYQRDRTQI